MFDTNIIGEANYLKTLNGDIIPLRIMLQNTNCDKISQMLTKSLQAIRYIDQDWILWECNYPILECIIDSKNFSFIKFIGNFQNYFIDFNDG